MTENGVISFGQWSELSRRVGGDLFNDPHKLEAMRRIDRAFGREVEWEKFCDLVIAEIEGKWIVAPSGKGKGLPYGTLPLTHSNKGAE